MLFDTNRVKVRERVNKVGDKLMLHRGAAVPRDSESLTRRQLSSLCGKLVGHYPVGG